MADQKYIEWAKAHQASALIKGGLLEPKSEHDYIGAAMVVRGVLFFPDAAEPAVRDEIAQCFDEYSKIASENLKWLWGNGKAAVTLKNGKLEPSAFRTSGKDGSLGVYVTSGEKAADASFWEFYVLGLSPADEALPQNGTSVLTFSMPVLYVAENPTAFQQLFVDFARRLKVSSGYAGYAVNLSFPEPEANTPTEYWLSTLFTGLDVGDPLSNATHLRDKIKTVGWLTAINKDMLDKVGGVTALRNLLPPNWFTFYDINGGVVIQAGPQPESGSSVDENGPPVLPANYVLVNRALRDIRVETVWRLQRGLGGTKAPLYNNTPASDRWLRRFDVPDDQLLHYQAVLLTLPELTADSKLPD